jgi:hypothetical protein
MNEESVVELDAEEFCILTGFNSLVQTKQMTEYDAFMATRHYMIRKQVESLIVKPKLMGTAK